jgi:ankyrin repeat protein
VRLLLDQGADVNAQVDERGNALQATAYKGYKRIVRLLPDRGADVYAQGGKYGSAIRAATLDDDLSIV